MIVVMLVTMLSIVHTKQRKHITDINVLGKEKGLALSDSPRRVFDPTGGFMTAQEISVSLSC